MPIYMESDNGGNDFPGDIKAHIKKSFPAPKKMTGDTPKPEMQKTECKAVDPMRLVP